MKLSRSNVRTLAVLGSLLIGTAVAVFFCAGVAFAGSLEATAHAVSTTNPRPADPNDPSFWRMGWGNSLHPHFDFDSVPRDDAEPTLGFMYRLSRVPIFPNDAYSSRVDISYDQAGSMIGHTLDLAGIYNSLPDAERLYAPASGQVVHDPREGMWFYNVRFFNESRLATDYTYFLVGYDGTAPRPVVGFTSGVVSPTETTRRVFTWLNAEYDDMSGTYWYELFLNGKSVEQMRAPLALLPGKATVEDLPPGVNSVGIRVVDRATNVSTFVYHTDIVDPDVPSLAITYPAASAWLNGTRTFSVNSTDLAGNPVVTFKIDGVVKGTDSAPPYQLKVDTTRLGAGGHTFTVVTKDLYGHTRSAAQAFNVDNTAIRLSSMSVTPNPFYPVLHDGYKDTAAMRVYLGEAATEAYLEIYDSGGAMVRKYKKTNVGAGTLSMTWDGKNSDGVVSTGNFWFRFVVKDRAGNWTKTGMSSIIIRDYELVRVGPDTVRIVPR